MQITTQVCVVFRAAGWMGPEEAKAREAAARREALLEAQSEVGNAFFHWGLKNEIAEPPLDWAWFGEIARRYSPLHGQYNPEENA